jgi:hypothetical protein
MKMPLRVARLMRNSARCLCWGQPPSIVPGEEVNMMAQRDEMCLSALRFEHFSDGGHGGQLQRRYAQDIVERRGRSTYVRIASSISPSVLSFVSVCPTVGPPLQFFRLQLLRPLLHKLGHDAFQGVFEKASLEWCRGNSKIWENPVRENTTHYTVGYTCKVVLRSYLALGCEVT